MTTDVTSLTNKQKKSLQNTEKVLAISTVTLTVNKVTRTFALTFALILGLHWNCWYGYLNSGTDVIRECFLSLTIRHKQGWEKVTLSPKVNLGQTSVDFTFHLLINAFISVLITKTVDPFTSSKVTKWHFNFNGLADHKSSDVAPQLFVAAQRQPLG